MYVYMYVCTYQEIIACFKFRELIDSVSYQAQFTNGLVLTCVQQYDAKMYETLTHIICANALAEIPEILAKVCIVCVVCFKGVSRSKL